MRGTGIFFIDYNAIKLSLSLSLYIYIYIYIYMRNANKKGHKKELDVTTEEQV